MNPIIAKALAICAAHAFAAPYRGQPPAPGECVHRNGELICNFSEPKKLYDPGYELCQNIHDPVKERERKAKLKKRAADLEVLEQAVKLQKSQNTKNEFIGDFGHVSVGGLRPIAPSDLPILPLAGGQGTVDSADDPNPTVRWIGGCRVGEYLNGKGGCTDARTKKEYPACEKPFTGRCAVDAEAH